MSCLYVRLLKWGAAANNKSTAALPPQQMRYRRTTDSMSRAAVTVLSLLTYEGRKIR